MTSIELRDKVKAAADKVAKIEKTIQRHEAQAAKKLEAIQSKGWDASNKYCREGTPEYNDAYWAICEYNYKLEDIKGATGKLKEALQVLDNWMAKLNKQLDIENKIAFEMPEIFRECQADLAQAWTEHDIARRDEMKELKRTLDHKEFRKLYDYGKEFRMDKTDEEFKKQNLRDAESFIIDLYNRVKAITGEITDYSGIHYGGKALNGLVFGENGGARVESILAGGYNIQRLHIRVLVHKLGA